MALVTSKMNHSQVTFQWGNVDRPLWVESGH